jgi:UDP-3-O-[3-hydroxymyristoyl] glucosamine N-acyltransferase
MQFTASQIAQLIDGKVEGNENEIVTSFGKIEEAKTSQLTFFANTRYENFLYSTTASVIILKNDYVLKQPLQSTLIRVEDPYNAFVILLSKYQEIVKHQMKGIQQPSYISSTAMLGENIFIGAFCYLGEKVKIGNNTKIYPNTYLGDNVEIGENSIIYAGVRIYSDCKVGNNAILHSGCVIGSDGFGFIPQPDGTVKKVPQVGNVIIEDDVEIGANTTIDRAMMGSTHLKQGVKLDNLIQVGHNVEIGRYTVMAGAAAMGGSVKIGNNVLVGGQAAFVEHIEIADRTKVGAQAKVIKSITTPGTSVNDTPAFDNMKALRSQAVYRNLPELEKRVKELEALVKQLLSEKIH